MAKITENRQWTQVQGRRLYDRRIARGLTQKEAARELHVTDDTVRNWETGQTRPRDENLKALADFCGTTIEDLFTEAAASARAAATSPTASVLNLHRWRFVVAILAIVLTVMVLAVAGIRNQTRFSQLRSFRNGIEAIDGKGDVLWRLPGVSPSIADEWVLARVPGRRKPLIACVVSPLNDFRLDTVQILSFLEPNRYHVVDRVRLTDVSRFFPSYAQRYDVAGIAAVDLDEDGLDEILVTYEQVPECPSYTVLYEPRLKRHRVIFAQTGAHHFTGAYDLDGDGKRELLFLGINNGFNWMNALAAIHVDPWISERSTGVNLAQFSPDHPSSQFHEQRGLRFYALLPRGGVPNDVAAVTWNARRRVITIRLLNNRIIELDDRGFLLNTSRTLPSPLRESLRRGAYRNNRDCRRLNLAQRPGESLLQCRSAVAAAQRSDDPILVEVMQRDLGKTLIINGHQKEGEALLRALALHSENASEIYYDAAVAFHLRGDLDRALTFYELGMGPSGNPEEGKSKHEFIQGEVLALAEQKAWREADAAIDRFHARYADQRASSTAVYRQFLRWRAGLALAPDDFVLPHNTTDLFRYWKLEFRNSRGDKTADLLQATDALLKEHNQPTGVLLSLRALLLSRLGRTSEAATIACEAKERGQKEARTSIVARGHLSMIEERCRTLNKAASTR